MNRDFKAGVSGIERRLRAGANGVLGRSGVSGDGSQEGQWWDLLPFTAHRIELSPGYHTRDEGAEAGTDLRTYLVVEGCGGSMEGRTVVDLGSLEGAFTIGFAELGAAAAIGIEARDINVRRAELARRFRRVENAEFVVADIKDELRRREAFDVVFAAGILYHVADPAGLLRTMRVSCTHMALIDTHVASRASASHGCSEVVGRESAGKTYQGRMFKEYASGNSDPAKEDLVWAAYSDTDSFWPFEDELVRMIENAGFTSVEKIDPSADGQQRPWAVDHENRVIYRAFV